LLSTNEQYKCGGSIKMADDSSSSMYSLESTIPEYSLVKKAILLQYYNAQNTLTSFDIKSTSNNHRRAREHLIILSRSLAFKSYVLTTGDSKKIFNNFLSSPNSYSNFDLHLIFSICSLILELLGLTKVETEELSKQNIYQEV